MNIHIYHLCALEQSFLDATWGETYTQYISEAIKLQRYLQHLWKKKKSADMSTLISLEHLLMVPVTKEQASTKPQHHQQQQAPLWNRPSSVLSCSSNLVRMPRLQIGNHHHRRLFQSPCHHPVSYQSPFPTPLKHFIHCRLNHNTTS
jgi:hypothetical protein